MEPVIAVVDYGMGNLRSVQKGLESAGGNTLVTRDPAVIRNSAAVVIPGVGAFKEAMDNLESYGLKEVILDVVKAGKPLLGICLGCQVLLSMGFEGGPAEGLGLILGEVRRFTCNLRVPHMGWNQVNIVRESPILKGIPGGAFAYFAHSYCVVPEDEEAVVATTEYGEPFASVVTRENVYGLQFHPEKSSAIGLRILKNFSECSRS